MQRSYEDLVTRLNEAAEKAEYWGRWVRWYGKVLLVGTISTGVLQGMRIANLLRFPLISNSD